MRRPSPVMKLKCASAVATAVSGDDGIGVAAIGQDADAGSVPRPKQSAQGGEIAKHVPSVARGNRELEKEGSRGVWAKQFGGNDYPRVPCVSGASRGEPSEFPDNFGNGDGVAAASCTPLR